MTLASALRMGNEDAFWPDAKKIASGSVNVGMTKPEDLRQIKTSK